MSDFHSHQDMCLATSFKTIIRCMIIRCYQNKTRRNNIYDVANANDYTPTGSYDNKYIRNHNLPAASKENTTLLKQPLLSNTNNSNENTSNETLRHSYNSINHKTNNKYKITKCPKKKKTKTRESNTNYERNPLKKKET